MYRVTGFVGFVFLCQLTSAQSYFYKDNIAEPNWMLEAGSGLGLMTCRSDLGGKAGIGPDAIDWKASHFCAGLLAVATYRQTIALRIGYVRGQIGAADSLIGEGPPGSRYDRNLHFRSNISEVTVMVEFYPFSRLQGNISTGRFQPYAMAGVGWYWFSPKAEINDQWVDLQPLHTEAQGFGGSGKNLEPSYPLNDVNIPVGMGLRWEAGAFVHLRLEALHRILFTDYLDDVSTHYPDPGLFDKFLPPATAALAALASDRRKSTPPFPQEDVRGNPGKNDAFFHLQISITMVLNRKKLK